MTFNASNSELTKAVFTNSIDLSVQRILFRRRQSCLLGHQRQDTVFTFFFLSTLEPSVGDIPTCSCPYFVGEGGGDGGPQQKKTKHGHDNADIYNVLTVPKEIKIKKYYEECLRNSASLYTCSPKKYIKKMIHTHARTHAHTIWSTLHNI